MAKDLAVFGVFALPILACIAIYWTSRLTFTAIGNWYHRKHAAKIGRVTR